MNSQPLLCLRILCAMLLLASADLLRAELLSLGEAIDVSGRQRMLTQRITKSYLQIGLDADATRSRRQIDEAIALFNAQHNQLKAFSPSDEITEALKNIEPVWNEFKAAARSDPDKTTAARLVELDETLLDMCEGVVYLIQDQAGDRLARLVNTAGRQRMLSQRLGKFYMLNASGLGTPSLLAKMDRSINEFKGALQTLKSAPDNTSAIDQKLEEVSEQWVWLDSSLTMQGDTYYPLIVDNASEKILVLMDAITGMYAKLDQAR